MSAPVVFLHGFLGAPTMWRNVEQALRSSVETTALELPGHGATPWLPEAPADFDAAVDALAARVPFKMPSLLVGYSMGARLALSLALRHPRRVAAAVLVGVDVGIEDTAMRAERRAWDDAWADRAAWESPESFATAWENLPIFDTQNKLPSAVRAELREQRTSHTRAGISWAMRALGLGRMPSLWPALAESRVPLSLVTGELDHKFTEKSAVICDRAPDARRVVVAGVGHNVALEAPAEVAKEIERRRAE